MGTNAPVTFSDEGALHVEIMRSIAQDLSDLPMVLKGGTALLLCYGLDRFSEDLDFDAPKKFNIAGRVEKILFAKTKGYDIRVVKDTATVQRLKIHYTGPKSERFLKIETSFRSSPEAADVQMLNGVKVYTVSALIAQKIKALTHRTAARDLYDVAFLSRAFPGHFSRDAVNQLVALMHDVNAVEQRFYDAFDEDEILDVSSLEAIILQITEFLNRPVSHNPNI